MALEITELPAHLTLEQLQVALNERLRDLQLIVKALQTSATQAEAAAVVIPVIVSTTSPKGTAGKQGQVVWDRVHEIFWICTEGGVAGTPGDPGVAIWVEVSSTIGQSHVDIGLIRYQGNWQAAGSAANGWIRTLYGSNIYWDEKNGVWQVPAINGGGTDWAAVVMLPGGHIALAAEEVTTLFAGLPTTRTTAQFAAALHNIFFALGGGTFAGDGVTWTFGDINGTLAENVILLQSNNQLVKLKLYSSAGGQLLNSLGSMMIRNQATGSADDLTLQNDGRDLLLTNAGRAITVQNNGTGDVTIGGAQRVVLKPGNANALILDTSGNLRLVGAAYASAARVLGVDGSGNVTAVLIQDIGGTLTTSQLPSSGLSTTVALAKITGGGADGSLTFTNGILTGKVDPT